MACLELPDGERWLLKGDAVTIGRDAGNDIALLHDTKVSRSHAVLQRRNRQWFLEDLGSSNGTRVNERRVQRHPLRHGDRIQLGGTWIVFVTDADPNATEAETSSPKKPLDLSERERQVLGLVAKGLTDREIGAQLFISPSTVRSHLDRIGEKSGLRRRTELTRLAVELGVEA